MKVNSLIFVFLTFVFISCNSVNKKELSANQYVKWFDENYTDFSFSKKIEDINYTLTYLPDEFLVAQQLLKDSTLKLKPTNNLLTFNLRISVDKGFIQEYVMSNYQEMQIRDNYFSFKMANDFYMEIIDTITNATHVIYQSGHGLSPNIDFLIHFNQTKPNNDFKVVFEDKIWGTGTVKFYIPTDKIFQIPQLKI